MRKILFSIPVLLAAVVSFSSCNGALDITQDNRLTASNMWQDANDVTTSTRGIYYLMRKNFMNRYTSVFYWSEVRVGECMWDTPRKTDISTKDCTDMLNNSMSSSTASCSWQKLYTTIDQANAVLKYAPQIQRTESEAG